MFRRLFSRAVSPPDGVWAPRYAYARQMGEDAARGLSAPWRDAQVMLQGIWRQESGGLSWEDARPVVYYAFCKTREAMVPDEDH